MDDLILFYEPTERKYWLYHPEPSVKILLSNQLTPMHHEYYSRILVPAMARMRQELENIEKEKQSVN